MAEAAPGAVPRIAYCTNVHAGIDLPAIEANLVRVAARVREMACPGETLGIGLWLPAEAAARLDVAEAARLRDRLAGLGLATVTLNGFPFRDFHEPIVKRAVYEPHWGRPERLAYTRKLAELLPALLPPGTADASISTLPIGWRETFAGEGCGAGVSVAAAQLAALVPDLARIEERTGVRIHVDLEPEPGCLLDRAEHVVALFEQCLAREPGALRHLGVCHDICHASVMFEPQAEALAAYRQAGIAVGKIQVSAAPEAAGDPASLSALAAFAEPRYLHQTSVRDERGTVRTFEDLPEALRAGPRGTWRTHFHVPIFLDCLGEGPGALRSTQADILACLAALTPAEQPTLEIETYAWPVLPEPLRPVDLAAGIAREVRWLKDHVR